MKLKIILSILLLASPLWAISSNSSGNTVKKIGDSTITGSLTVTSSVTANTFIGNGSGITGVTDANALTQSSATITYTNIETFSGSMTIITNSLDTKLSTGVTQIIAGTNITITPTDGRGNVTINSSGGGGAGVAGSTASITINGGGFDIPSLNGAINFKDEYLISGASVPYNYTMFHEATINYAYKTIYAPNYLNDAGGYTVTLIWISTQTTGNVVWELGISTTNNFRTDNWVAQSATTTVSGTAYNINSTVFNLASQSIVAGQPFKVRLRRIADSSDDTMAGYSNVLSLNIAYKRLY